MTGALKRSQSWCRRVARQRAKNFYAAFLLLSRDQRTAMCAVYAFMRHCDDLSDEPGASLEAIDRWRDGLAEALEGHYNGHPAWPALHDAVRKYRIPHEYLYEMIEGIRSDLEERTFANFDELYRYCYRVASVAGLITIHVFGFDSPQALPLAEKCGIAFQLTNILRDIREDSQRGRVYLPAEDLARFHVHPEELKAGARTANFLALMRFEATRARGYYEEAMPLLELVHPSSRPALDALIATYSRLLDRIERSNFDVFSRRIRLSGLEKTWILARALVSLSTKHNQGLRS